MNSSMTLIVNLNSSQRDRGPSKNLISCWDLDSTDFDMRVSSFQTYLIFGESPYGNPYRWATNTGNRCSLITSVTKLFFNMVDSSPLPNAPDTRIAFCFPAIHLFNSSLFSTAIFSMVMG